MSMESARKFCVSVQKDKKFVDSLKAQQDETEIAKLVLEAGFDFTMDELDQVLKTALSTPSTERELSDTEMQAVAGGMFGNPMGGEGGFQRIMNQIGNSSLSIRAYK